MKWLELPVYNTNEMVTVNPGRILTVREVQGSPNLCSVEMNIPHDRLIISLPRSEVHRRLLAL